jgi:peptide/nickel transport system substrate-binding protein
MIVPQENEPRKLMAATVQEDLAKLGIKVEIAPIEFKAVTERWTKTYDYDAILLGLSVTDVEPSSFANFLTSTGEAHQWQPNQKTPATDWEKQIDDLFAQQAAETDPAKRKAAFNEIQRIMAEQVPVIPIVARHVVSAANTRVTGLDPSPIVPYSLWNADQISVSSP